MYNKCMNRIEWNDNYLLGISEIDVQHKKLLALANDLYDVIAGDDEGFKIQMSVVLKKLTDYTVYHFESEEKFMELHGYTGVSVHKMAHDSFIKEVNNQINLLSSNNKDSAAKFYTFITNWVLTHIAKADQIWAKVVKG